jgi:type IV secretory pathway component VirB8
MDKDNLDPDISQSIEDKSYFQDGLSWYMHKFCSPLSERFFWSFILILSAILLYALQQNISAWYPLKEKRPIIIHNSDTKFKQVVKKMEQSYNQADYNILNYLIKNYVLMREDFDNNSTNLLEVDQRIKKIANNSTMEVTREYQKLFSLNNARNPIKRLGKSGKRKIKITNIDINIVKRSLWEKAFNFNKVIALPRFATIYYKSTEKVGSRVSIEHRQVNMGFNYSGVIIDHSKNSFILEKFIVTDYQQKILKK